MQHRERPIHLAVLTYLRTVLPDALVHHSPGGLDLSGKDVERAVAKAKHLGMVPGWPDLIVLHRGSAMFLEVKAEGGRLSAAQREFQTFAAEAGFRHAVVRSVEDVRETLAEWAVETREAAS